MKYNTGVCAKIPPTIAELTKIPTMNARYRGGNHSLISFAAKIKPAEAPTPAINEKNQHLLIIARKP